MCKLCVIGATKVSKAATAPVPLTDSQQKKLDNEVVKTMETHAKKVATATKALRAANSEASI